MKISVVIPVYREVGIAALLDDLAQRPDLADTEILVVDGASACDTLARVTRPEVVRLASSPGRGQQQNTGAAAASGDVLLFLHADTTLPPDAFALIRRVLTDPDLAGGAFHLAYDDPRPAYTLLAQAAHLRSSLTRVPYGDQAIFLRRDVFRHFGGFAAIPIMEDVELMTRMRRAGLAIRILETPVLTSPRRQQREGLLRCTLRNLGLRLLYHLGVPPRLLAHLYRPHAG